MKLQNLLYVVFKSLFCFYYLEKANRKKTTLKDEKRKKKKINCEHFPKALKKQTFLSWPEIYFIVKHNKNQNLISIDFNQIEFS